MDRQGARTPADLESKYKFGKAFSEVTAIANDAKKKAEGLDEDLNGDEIFNRLTGGGQMQGIYKEGDKIYINASYIKTGTFLADLIKAGVIRSIDGESIVIDLDKGTAMLTGSLKTVLATDDEGDEVSAEMSAGEITVITQNRSVTIDKFGVNVVYDDGITKCGVDLSANPRSASITLRDYDTFVGLQIVSGDKWLQLNGGKITGLNAPKDDTDAANKAYVDAQIAALKAQLS
jgi:hypothetical protein